MVALRIEDIKGFTSKLFVKEDFDSFLLKEAKIATFAEFSVNGRIKRGFFSREELESLGPEGLAPWRMARPHCFDMIRGKRLPESFHIVLELPESQVERFAAAAGQEAGQVQGMYLNIRYEDGALYCVTGFAMSVFTLDKTLESLWDDRAEEFLKRLGIACVRE